MPESLLAEGGEAHGFALPFEEEGDDVVFGCAVAKEGGEAVDVCVVGGVGFRAGGDVVGVPVVEQELADLRVERVGGRHQPSVA